LSKKRAEEPFIYPYRELKTSDGKDAALLKTVTEKRGGKMLRFRKSYKDTKWEKSFWSRYQAQKRGRWRVGSSRVRGKKELKAI